MWSISFDGIFDYVDEVAEEVDAGALFEVIDGTGGGTAEVLHGGCVFGVQFVVLVFHPEADGFGFARTGNEKASHEVVTGNGHADTLTQRVLYVDVS